MINLYESMGPGQDQTTDPSIYSPTHYRLCYEAQYTSVKDKT